VADPHDELRFRHRRTQLLLWSARWTELVAEIDIHERLAAELDPSYDRHNYLELLRSTAEYRKTGNVADVVADALRCARDESASIGHRLDAAKQCARLAGFGSLLELREAHAIAQQLHPRSLTER